MTHGETQSPANPWIVAVAVMSATFLEVLDTTVVNVSLPHIAGTLSATIDESTWVLTSYLVANAVILPMTGWIARYFGRRRFLLASVTTFTLASFLCGAAPNLQTLVLFRVAQGASGGALQPISQAVMLEAFPPAERGRAMGFWGLGIVVAPILGPVLGGWLTDSYSWRWVFYINGPVGLASVLLIRRYVFDPPYLRRTGEGIDYWGIGLLALGIASLQLLLDTGQQADWFASSAILALAVIAGVALAAFVVYELRAEAPVVDLRVFRVRDYSAGVFLMTVLGFVLYGSLVMLPLMLQTLLGYPALQAGIAMAPRGIGAFLFMPIAGALVSRYDPRQLVGVGLVIGSGTLFWLGQLNLQAGYWDVFWPQLVQGASLGLIFVPLTTISMHSIPVAKMGNATSLFNLMRNIGASIGIAMSSTWLVRRQQMHTGQLATHLDAYHDSTHQAFEAVRSSFVAAGTDLVTAGDRAYAMLEAMVGRQASMLAFVGIFRLLGGMFLVLAPLLFVMRRPTESGDGRHAPGSSNRSPSIPRGPT